MAQEPVPGAGRDGEPVPPGPRGPGPGGDGEVTPDWIDDAEWELICASRTAEDEPDFVREDWDAGGADPEDGPPADWAGVSLEELTAQAEADGSEHSALMGRLLAAGVGDGYAHRAGEPPVPGCSPVRRRGSGRAGAWTPPRRSQGWPCWPIRPQGRTGPSRTSRTISCSAC